MNNAQQNPETAALFILLRAGLWGNMPEDLSVFPLSGKSWHEVLLLARRQTVVGIVYEGMCRLPHRLMPPEGILFRWLAEVNAIEQRNRRMNAALAGLYAFFGEHGLRPVVQKGQGVALFYENPSARDCGDIDFYFPAPSAGKQAEALVREAGKHIEKEADGSFHYTWDGVEVEHHSALFDLGNPFARGRLKELEVKEGFRPAPLASAGDFSITVPAPLPNLLLLNTHILKHALGWGIGLRQLCDMARAYHALHGEVDGNELHRLCGALGIGKWSNMLHAFLTGYMGLPPSALPFGDAGESPLPLLDIVTYGGNFGFHGAGRSQTNQALWKRKLGTARSFLRNVRFASTYAPKEAFWTFTNLLAGQFTR